MRTMTVIFTTLILVATASVAQTANNDETDVIGPPPVYGEDSHESIGPPPTWDGGDEAACLACGG